MRAFIVLLGLFSVAMCGSIGSTPLSPDEAKVQEVITSIDGCKMNVAKGMGTIGMGFRENAMFRKQMNSQLMMLNNQGSAVGTNPACSGPLSADVAALRTELASMNSCGVSGYTSNKGNLNKLKTYKTQAQGITAACSTPGATPEDVSACVVEKADAMQLEVASLCAPSGTTCAEQRANWSAKLTASSQTFTKCNTPVV